MSGTTLVHSRRHFQKRFDLAERLMPDALALRATRRRRLPALAPAPVAPRHGRGDGDGSADVSDLPARGRRRAPPLARPPARDRRGARDRRAGAGSADPAAVVCPGRGSARPRGGGTTPDRLRGHHPARPLRLLPVAPRAHPPPLRLPLHDRGLHARPQAHPRLLHAAHLPRRPAHRPRRPEDPPRRAPPRDQGRALRALVRPRSRAARRDLGPRSTATPPSRAWPIRSAPSPPSSAPTRTRSPSAPSRPRRSERR